jgi:ParB-like chromosome segregation protein Spo0J
VDPVDEGEPVAVADLDERFAHLRVPQSRHLAAMRESMRRFGQISPLVVSPQAGTLAVVDGFKRLRAARDLGMEEVLVRRFTLTAQAAVAAIYGMNRGGRGLCDLEESLVVRELVRRFGLTQPEVGELLERDKSWVSRRLALVERLCPEVQDDVRAGLVPITVAREVARLPRGNQPEVSAAVHKHGLTSREATLLVGIFERQADRDRQRALLDDPRPVLDAHRTRDAVPAHDVRLGERANAVRRQIHRLVEEASRLARMLDESAAAGLTAGERVVLAPILRQAEGAATRLAAALGSVIDAFRIADGGR